MPHSRDRAGSVHTSHSTSPDKQIEQHLRDIRQPATYAQVSYFWDLGLRERTLTLPVMMTLVLSMIWHQIGSVSELVRTVRRHSLLWMTPRRLTQQAILQRLDSLLDMQFSYKGRP